MEAKKKKNYTLKIRKIRVKKCQIRNYKVNRFMLFIIIDYALKEM